MQSVFFFLLLSILQGNAAPTGSVTSEGLLDSIDLSSTAFSSIPSNCSLNLMPGTDLQTLKESLQENSLLENVKIHIWNYSSDFLDQKLAGFVKPNHWFRVRKTTGMSLLLWEDTFWNLLEVHYAQSEYMSDLNITLMDNPFGCLRSLSANDTSLAIRTLILNDFDTENSNKQDDQISANMRVCSKIVKEDKGSASLVYFCCEKKPDGDVTCAEAFPNMWLQIVMQLYFPLLIVLFLYSPSVINYILSLGMYTTYQCKLRKPCLPKVQDLSSEYKKCKVTNGEECLKALLKKRVASLEVTSATLLIKSQRLLKQNGTPIGFRKLVISLFSCRFRSLRICKFKKQKREEEAEDQKDRNTTEAEDQKDRNTTKKWLCEKKILPRVKLYQCLQVPTKIIIALLFSVPFIIMCLNFSSSEDWKEIERVEKQLNLTLATKRVARLSMIIVYGMCLSTFYAFALVDLLSLGWLWKRTRPIFYKTFQSTVKCNEKAAVNGIRKWLTCPFQSGYFTSQFTKAPQNNHRILVFTKAPQNNHRILVFTKALKKTRILWYIPYICLTSIWIIICWLRETPLALFLYHTKHASFESSKMCNCKIQNRSIKWNAVLMGVLMLNFFIGLVHWILFVIYVFFFAMVGIIIYVEPMMNILLGLVILFNYGRSTFHKVKHDYLLYHRRIFKILMRWQGYEKVLEIQKKIDLKCKSSTCPNNGKVNNAPKTPSVRNNDYNYRRLLSEQDENKDTSSSDQKGNDDESKDTSSSDQKGNDDESKGASSSDQKGNDDESKGASSSDQKGNDDESKGASSSDQKDNDDESKGASSSDQKGNDDESKGASSSDQKGNDDESKGASSSDQKGNDDESKGASSSDQKGNGNESKGASSSDQKGNEGEIDVDNYIVPVSPSKIPYSLPGKLSEDKQKRLLLTIKHMFLLLDENGNLFIPMKFFWKTTKINSCLAPGSADKRCFAAFVSFLKIVIFLVIVLIVVIAFGDMYRISLTNQLLVTMAASFVPRLFELINSNSTTIDEEDDAFEEKLKKTAEGYEEAFPVKEESSISCYKIPPKNIPSPNTEEQIMKKQYKR